MSWCQSKPCPKHNKIIVAVNLCHLCGLWSQVFGFNGFGHCLWQNTSSLLHFTKDFFSVCGREKSLIHCVCLLVGGIFNDLTPWFFLWALLNTPSSSMGFGYYRRPPARARADPGAGARIVDWSFFALTPKHNGTPT